MSRLLAISLTSAFFLGTGCQPQQNQGMEQFANDKDFHAAHTLRETPSGPHKGEMVEIAVPGGEKSVAYWVTPGEDPDKAIVMVHEWWGLNDYIKESADAFADEGYAVLAVDLYEGRVAKNRDDAGKYMGEVKEDRATAVVRAALDALTDGKLAKDASIGTIGFCFGGGWSHRAAILGGDRVDACVIYYGAPVMDQGELAKLKAPVLFVWPNKDKWINAEMKDGFVAAMRQAGKELTVAEYTADHAFANPSSDSHDDEAAKDARAKTLAFFKEHLRG
ncbi:MAG: dienelactone hydrolase family protein [Fimbriimonadaceae bacterium]|nr:dienelactone hydrolase family protein [Fimbriimonadaceae bacterium]QYK56594.1 MAG: dienelactone hydrolase family protein [Fimbriimonadaceae bacterium]